MAKSYNCDALERNKFKKFPLKPRLIIVFYNQIIVGKIIMNKLKLSVELPMLTAFFNISQI